VRDDEVPGLEWISNVAVGEYRSRELMASGVNLDFKAERIGERLGRLESSRRVSASGGGFNQRAAVAVRKRWQCQIRLKSGLEVS